VCVESGRFERCPTNLRIGSIDRITRVITGSRVFRAITGSRVFRFIRVVWVTKVTRVIRVILIVQKYLLGLLHLGQSN
jgi:hypothetical protein